MIRVHVSEIRWVITKLCLGLGYNVEMSQRTSDDTSPHTVSGKPPPVNKASQRNLSIRVSIVTTIFGNMYRYTIPGVCLHTPTSDACP
jgi:hypothetical protein